MGNIIGLVNIIKLIIQIVRFIREIIQPKPKDSETFKNAVDEMTRLSSIKDPDERVRKRKDELKKIVDNF